MDIIFEANTLEIVCASCDGCHSVDENDVCHGTDQ